MYLLFILYFINFLMLEKIIEQFKICSKHQLHNIFYFIMYVHNIFFKYTSFLPETIIYKIKKIKNIIIQPMQPILTLFSMLYFTY